MVALADDGGFNMTMGDLETAERSGMNFVFCVFNNAVSGLRESPAAPGARRRAMVRSVSHR